MRLSEKLGDALNVQVRNEMIATYTYMGLAAWCDANNYPGMAHWMKMQVKEEMFHVWKLYDFLNDNGYEVKLLDVPAPTFDVSNPTDVFEESLSHEQMVTENYYKLNEIAIEDKVYNAQGIIQWFLNEQIEEEKNVSDVLDMVKRMEGHPGSMMMLDKDLLNRAAPAVPTAE